MGALAAAVVIGGLTCPLRPALSAEPVAAASSPGGPQEARSSSRTAVISRFAAVSSSSMGDMVRYRAQQVLTMSILGKLGVIILMAVPVVLVGGFVYRIVTGSSWREAMFKVYTVLNDAPGAAVTDEGSFLPGMVLNVVFMFGVFTFAILLGVVCDDISGVVTNVREGNSSIPEAGHTVILGWNSQTKALLNQVAVAQHERRGGQFPNPVVVLADMEKHDMDAELADMPDVCGQMQVMTRSGKPYVLASLENISAGAAKTVIIMANDGADNDAKTAATLMGLSTSGGGPAAGQSVLVQQNTVEHADPHGYTNMAAAMLTPPGAPGRIQRLNEGRSIHRLQAQCALQPGLGRVDNSLLTQGFGDVEVYVKDFPDRPADATTFGEVRRLFRRCAVVGFAPQGGATVLNPPDSAPVALSDDIIAVAYNDAAFKIEPYEVARAAVARRPAADHAPAPTPRNILVACFGELPQGVLEGLGEFGPRGTKVTVLSDAERLTLPKNMGGCRFVHKRAAPNSSEGLLKAGLGSADAVIVTGMQDVEDPGVHDAQVLSCLLHLQDLSSAAGRQGRPLHVVANTFSVRTAEMVRELQASGALSKNSSPVPGQTTGNFPRNPPTSITYDLLRSQELSSGILTQVAAQPKVLAVFDDMFDDAGCEVYLRSASRFGLEDAKGPMTWGEVCEVVRSRDACAIGYISSDGRLNMVPDAAQEVHLSEHDDIVVFSEEH